MNIRPNKVGKVTDLQQIKISIINKYETSRTRQFLFVALFLWLILLIWGLDALPLFDWDEINFAEIAREMIETGNYLQPTVNYLPFHEKPPLFSWMQVLSMKFASVGSLGARLPNVLCGLFTLLFVGLAGKRRHGTIFGVWWALLFATSLLPLLYFRSGIIDPWFNLFIFSGLWLTVTEQFRGRLILAGLLLGLAVLTKGPVALLVAGLCLLTSHLGATRRGWQSSISQWTGMAPWVVLPALLWLLFLWQEDGGYFAREFLTYQWRLLTIEDAGHGGFPGYHFIVLLLGCFPASVYALLPLWKRRAYATDSDQLMRILFWVVLILFSLVNTKIVHYSSLCYFPLTYFGARFLSEGESLPRWAGRLLTGIFLLYFLAIVVVVTAGLNTDLLLAYLSDPELASRLAMPVEWSGWGYVAGLPILIWMILKKHEVRTVVAAYATWMLTMTLILPRIQPYTQGATVEFFSKLEGEDINVGTAYYKSYAHWFYAAIPPERGGIARQQRFHGPCVRALYFASPLRHTERVLEEVPDAEVLYQKGGFTFYQRPLAE